MKNINCASCGHRISGLGETMEDGYSVSVFCVKCGKKNAVKKEKGEVKVKAGTAVNKEIVTLFKNWT